MTKWTVVDDAIQNLYLLQGTYCWEHFTLPVRKRHDIILQRGHPAIKWLERQPLFQAVNPVTSHIQGE